MFWKLARMTCAKWKRTRRGHSIVGWLRSTIRHRANENQHGNGKLRCLEVDCSGKKKLRQSSIHDKGHEGKEGLRVKWNHGSAFILNRLRGFLCFLCDSDSYPQVEPFRLWTIVRANIQGSRQLSGKREVQCKSTKVCVGHLRKKAFGDTAGPNAHK